MTIFSKIVSLIMLGLVIAPCVLFFCGLLSADSMKMAALVGTAGWFVATPLWIGR